MQSSATALDVQAARSAALARAKAHIDRQPLVQKLTKIKEDAKAGVVSPSLLARCSMPPYVPAPILAEYDVADERCNRMAPMTTLSEVQDLQDQCSQLKKDHEQLSIDYEKVCASLLESQTENMMLREQLELLRKRGSEDESPGSSKKPKNVKLVDRTKEEVYTGFIKLKPALGVSSFTFKDEAAVDAFWKGCSEAPLWMEKVKWTNLPYMKRCDSIKKLLNALGYSCDHKTFTKQLTWYWSPSRAIINMYRLRANAEVNERTKTFIERFAACFEGNMQKITLGDDDVGFRAIDEVNVETCVKQAFVFDFSNKCEPRKQKELVFMAKTLRELRHAQKITQLHTVSLHDPDMKIKNASKDW